MGPLSGRSRTRTRGAGAARRAVTTVLAGPTCTMVLLELKGSAGSRLAWVIPAAGTTTRTRSADSPREHLLVSSDQALPCRGERVCYRTHEPMPVVPLLPANSVRVPYRDAWMSEPSWF